MHTGRFIRLLGSGLHIFEINIRGNFQRRIKLTEVSQLPSKLGNSVRKSSVLLCNRKKKLILDLFRYNIIYQQHVRIKYKHEFDIWTISCDPTEGDRKSISSQLPFLFCLNIIFPLQPFTGKYYDHHEKGTYICVCCSTPLFR